jgi:GNAT superfamily N-acetyltransferase
MTEEHWRWKAKGRPTPVENVGIAVAADDRPIFQFVGIPCPAIVLGAPRIIMVGADVVTDPDFRRRGVFTATVRRLFDTWREAGVALVIGLANDRWGSRADALGYERWFQLPWRIRPLRPERILARKARLPGLARLRGMGGLWNRVWDRPTREAPGITVRPLGSATACIDAIWTRGLQQVTTSVVRDRAWVTWRYAHPPEGDYRLTLAERAGSPAGYAAYRVDRTAGRTVVRVPEIFAPGDDAALRALVRDVVARARAEDAESIVTLAVRGSHMDRELRRAGFLFSPGAYRLEVVRLDTAIPAAALADPGAWWLVGGDFDVI